MHQVQTVWLNKWFLRLKHYGRNIRKKNPTLNRPCSNIITWYDQGASVHLLQFSFRGICTTEHLLSSPTMCRTLRQCRRKESYQMKDRSRRKHLRGNEAFTKGQHVILQDKVGNWTVDTVIESSKIPTGVDSKDFVPWYYFGCVNNSDKLKLRNRQFIQASTNRMEARKKLAVGNINRNTKAPSKSDGDLVSCLRSSNSLVRPGTKKMSLGGVCRQDV